MNGPDTCIGPRQCHAVELVLEAGLLQLHAVRTRLGGSADHVSGDGEEGVMVVVTTGRGSLDDNRSIQC